MLGARQRQIVGYLDSFVGAEYCFECAKSLEREGTNIQGEDWCEIIRYEVEEMAREIAYADGREETVASDYPTCSSCGDSIGYERPAGEQTATPPPAQAQIEWPQPTIQASDLDKLIAALGEFWDRGELERLEFARYLVETGRLNETEVE